MRYSKHFIAAVVVMTGALLSGCATSGDEGIYKARAYKTAPPLASENTQDPNAPNVVISRYDAAPYLLQSRIYVDGVEQVRLKNKQYAEIRVEPGEHLFEVKYNPITGQRGAKHTYVVEENKVLGLNISDEYNAISMISGAILIRLEQVEPSTQAREVKNCCTKVDVK